MKDCPGSTIFNICEGFPLSLLGHVGVEVYRIPGRDGGEGPCIPLIYLSMIDLPVPQGMQGLLTRSRSSEFDDFEDRIIPTGSKVIDIGYLLAPSSENNSDTNAHDENDNPLPSSDTTQVCHSPNPN